MVHPTRPFVNSTVECKLSTIIPSIYAYDRCAFERRIPYELRCRTALVSLPSAYPDARVAEAESPALNRRDLRRAFEQHWLALIVSETIVNLTSSRPLLKDRRILLVLPMVKLSCLCLRGVM
jgi:hypothetical protein